VGDGIRFEEAGPRFVPLVEFQGDLVTQEGSGFGGGASSFFVVEAGGLKESVDGSRRDFYEGLRDVWCEVTKGLDISGQPYRDDRLEAFGAG
jgi:hypothetical protein